MRPSNVVEAPDLSKRLSFSHRCTPRVYVDVAENGSEMRTRLVITVLEHRTTKDAVTPKAWIRLREIVAWQSRSRHISNTRVPSANTFLQIRYSADRCQMAALSSLCQLSPTVVVTNSATTSNPAPIQFTHSEYRSIRRVLDKSELTKRRGTFRN